MSGEEYWLQRTEKLLGPQGLKALAEARVAVFGLGGVGGHAVETLARSGVGALDLIDSDRVDLTNLNRQIIATIDTVGMDKVEAARQRILSVNPHCRVTCHKVFYLPETADTFDFSSYDYIVDAIDTVSGKIQLVKQAAACGVPIISSMGTGNKLDPARLEVADIYETSVCPLAKVMRKELRSAGIKSLKVVYSREIPIKPITDEENAAGTSGTGSDRPAGRPSPGSTAFVPAAAGIIMASEVVKDLCFGKERV